MIDPNIIDLVTIAGLPTSAFSVNDLIGKSDSNGNMTKNNLGLFASFIAPYVSAVGASGLIFSDPSIPTVLPDGSGTGIYATIVKSGTYSQTNGADITANGDINVLSRTAGTDGVWSVGSEININLDDYLKIDDFNEQSSILISEENRINYFKSGNNNVNFWTNNYAPNTALNVFPNSYLSAKIKGFDKGLYISNTSAGSEYLIQRNINILEGQNLVVGMWVRLSDISANPPAGFGFYLQAFDASNNVVSSGNPVLNISEINTKGSAKVAVEARIDVLEIDGGWSYLASTFINPLPANTSYATISIYAVSPPSGMAVYLESISCLLGSTIKPYMPYTNAIYSKLAGLRIVLDGDSISQQGPLASAIQSLSKGFVNNSMSVSGSGYSTNGLMAQPSFESTARTTAIKNAKADVIILQGGINSPRSDTPLGLISDIPSSTDYTKFYPSVYKRITQVMSDNPKALVVVLNFSPSYYMSETPYIANGIGLTQVDYANALEYVAEYLSAPYYNLFRLSGINTVTESNTTNDGLHFSNENAVPIAKRIISFIEDYL